MESKDSFDPLEVINGMLIHTRSSVSKNDSFYYLYWGYASIIICLMVYLGYWIFEHPLVHLCWLLFLPVYIGHAVIQKKRWQKEQVVTKMDKIIQQVWSGFSIAAIGLSLGSVLLQWAIMPVFLVALTIPLYSNALILNVPVLRWGSVMLLIGAIVGFYIGNSEDQLIVYACSMIAGYIIPAHIFRNQFAHV